MENVWGSFFITAEITNRFTFKRLGNPHREPPRVVSLGAVPNVLCKMFTDFFFYRRQKQLSVYIYKCVLAGRIE